MTVQRSTLYQYLEQLTEQQLQQVTDFVILLMGQEKKSVIFAQTTNSERSFMRFAGIAIHETSLLMEVEQDVLLNRSLNGSVHCSNGYRTQRHHGYCKYSSL